MAASRLLHAVAACVILLSFAAGSRKSYWSGCMKAATVICQQIFSILALVLFLLHVGLEQCEVWGVKSAVWSVKEAVGSEKCEVWSVKFKFGVRSAQCEVWSVRFGVWRKQWEVRSVKCGLWSAKCEVWSVECEVSSLECEECSVKCEVWSVKTLLRLSLKKSNGCRGKDTVGTGCLWTIGHLCLGNFRRRLARVYVNLINTNPRRKHHLWGVMGMFSHVNPWCTWWPEWDICWLGWSVSAGGFGVLTLIRMQGVPLVGYDMQPGQDWFTDTSAIKLPTVSWHDSGIPAASQWSFNMQTIWNSHCRILSMHVAGAKSHHCMSRSCCP